MDTGRVGPINYSYARNGATYNTANSRHVEHSNYRILTIRGIQDLTGHEEKLNALGDQTQNGLQTIKDCVDGNERKIRGNSNTFNRAI